MWEICPRANGDVIVLPINDTREHDRLSADCPCMPQVTVYGAHVVITHNAFDFRHITEWLNAEDYDQDHHSDHR